MKRITTAREQFDMLSPWLITADTVLAPGGKEVERPQIIGPEYGPPTAPPKKERPAPQPRQLDFWDVPNRKEGPALEGPRPQKEKPSLAPADMELQLLGDDTAPGEWGREVIQNGKAKNEVAVSPNGNRYRQIGDIPVQVGEDGELPKSQGAQQPVLSPEHPSKGGAPKDPEWESLSSNLARFLLPEELERSLIDKYNASDEGTREAGSQWYDTANQYIRNLAEKTGRDPAQVAAIVSAFSPQTSWDANMAAANYFMMNFDPNNPNAIDDKMGGLGDNLERAKRIYGANDEDGYLAGLQNGNDAHKITNFYHNLMGSKDHVTIDSWMARALLGEGADGLADKSVQKVLNWKDGYDTMANSVRSAAQKLGISPRELQAIVWSQVVPTAGSYEELTPEQYAKQKKQRENYINKAPENAKLLPDYFHGPAWESRPEPTYRNKRGMRFWSGIQDDKYPQHWMDKAEQLAKETGGFTIHDEPGDGPTTGYQVAIPGYERQDINTGQGWADYAHQNQDALKGNYLGTWNDGENFWTEPSQNFSDYDDAARATVDRNQWSMWDNSAFRINPQTGEKEFFSQADIPRHDIINQGLAGALGFTLAKNRGISYRTAALNPVKHFWEG
jgi:hypothetical protein